MNQNKIKVNNKIYKNRWFVFIFCQVTLLFILILFWLGYQLWFQALLLSCAFSILSFWFFFKALNNTFPSKDLIGYDPWHLQPLLKKTVPFCNVSISERETPFCFSYDFFSSRMILSSALLKNLTQDELKILFSFQKVYFEKGFAIFFTQITYLLGILFSPFLLLQWILNKCHLYFLDKVILRIFFIFHLPFYPIISYLIYHCDRVVASQMTEKNQLSLLLQKLQSYFEHSQFYPHFIFSLLFLTNPLTPLHSYSTMQPSIETRMKKVFSERFRR